VSYVRDAPKPTHALTELLDARRGQEVEQLGVSRDSERLRGQMTGVRTRGYINYCVGLPFPPPITPWLESRFQVRFPGIESHCRSARFFLLALIIILTLYSYGSRGSPQIPRGYAEIPIEWGRRVCRGFVFYPGRTLGVARCGRSTGCVLCALWAVAAAVCGGGTL